MEESRFNDLVDCCFILILLLSNGADCVIEMSKKKDKNGFKAFSFVSVDWLDYHVEMGVFEHRPDFMKLDQRERKKAVQVTMVDLILSFFFNGHYTLYNGKGSEKQGMPTKRRLKTFTFSDRAEYGRNEIGQASIPFMELLREKKGTIGIQF